MRNLPGENDCVFGAFGYSPQPRLFHSPTHQKQARAGKLFYNFRKRIQKKPEPFVVVERPDEPEHGTSVKTDCLGQANVSGARSKPLHVNTIGNHDHTLRVHASLNDLLAHPFADRDDPVGFPEEPTLKGSA